MKRIYLFTVDRMRGPFCFRFERVTDFGANSKPGGGGRGSRFSSWERSERAGNESRLNAEGGSARRARLIVGG